MRIQTLMLAVALTALSPASFALAQQSASPPDAATAPASNTDLDRVVCHAGAAPTGSRLGARRECHTQRQWDAMRQVEQQSLSQQQIQITTTTRGH